jgi:hypothetical protein
MFYEYNTNYGVEVTIGISLVTTLAPTTLMLIQSQSPNNSVTGVKEWINAEKSLVSSPDETRSFQKAKINLANLGNITIGRRSIEPEWSWEKWVKSIVKTNRCQVLHPMYIISSRIKVVMDDRTESEVASLTWQVVNISILNLFYPPNIKFKQTDIVASQKKKVKVKTEHLLWNRREDIKSRTNWSKSFLKKW